MRAVVTAFSRPAVLCLLMLVPLACDDDPNAPLEPFPDFSLEAVPDTLEIEAPIRVVFSDSLSAATALDQANFVVTNLCTGLRVPGALRLNGDTLIFTPSQPFPFLTVLGIRIQNLLTPSGVPQPQPIAFQRTTEPPPIRDQSWTFLDSPTNDPLTGVSFVDEQVGYVSEAGGTIYRTTDGGQAFLARFKDPDVTLVGNLRAFSDTLYFVAARRVGNTAQRSVFRSVDAGQSFTQVVTVPERLFLLSMRRIAGLQEGVFGGAASVYRFTGNTGVATLATGTPGSSVIISGVELSPSGSTALASFRGIADPQTGLAHVSLDGGRSFTPLALPSGVYGLAGVGYASDNVAFVLGDSSVVLRFNPTSATPTFTLLGASAGIPQTEVNATTGELISYSFRRTQFAPDGTTGWIIGSFTRRRPGVPDIQGGVILQSDDGGLTWRRQAIAGALENGLSFSVPLDLQALRADFAVVSGQSGVIAARIGESQSGALCSLSDTP